MKYIYLKLLKLNFLFIIFLFTSFLGKEVIADKKEFDLSDGLILDEYLLENAMHRAMQEKQYSAVASNAKVLMRLVGLYELRRK